MNTDPIADLLTRIRNALKARHEFTTVPASRLKKEILRIMKEKNCILDFSEMKEPTKPQGELRINFVPGKLFSLNRISKPGQRMYQQYRSIKPVFRGFGFSILSTSEGVMTGDQARKKGLGGEVLCEVGEIY